MWHFSIPNGGRRALVGPVLLLAAAPAMAQVPKNPQEPRNLVSNGSFENPPVPANGSQRMLSARAWTATAGTIELQNRLGTLAAYTGDQYLALNSSAVVRQVCTTIPGQSYSLSFAFSPHPPASGMSFEVWFA